MMRLCAICVWCALASLVDCSKEPAAPAIQYGTTPVAADNKVHYVFFFTRYTTPKLLHKKCAPLMHYLDREIDPRKSASVEVGVLAAFIATSTLI